MNQSDLALLEKAKRDLELKRARQRRYWATHREILNAKARAYHAANREAINARARTPEQRFRKKLRKCGISAASVL